MSRSPSIRMTTREAIAKAHWLIEQANIPFIEEVSLSNFLDFTSLAADVVRYSMTPKQREAHPWLRPWAEAIAKARGEFDSLRAADPLITYSPKTSTHAAFHASTAYWRYAMCANGTGKTTMGFVEDYLTATGQRLGGGYDANRRGDVGVVSVGHSTYTQTVFERKFLTGEDGNPFAPIFPENGKWFHSYESRLYTINVACPECAEAGRPKQCGHTKSIKCFTDDGGWERFQGASYKMVHLDEHVDEFFFTEGCIRTKRGDVNGRGMVTGTPLFGLDAWEIEKLLNRWKGNLGANLEDPTDPTSAPFVDVFMITAKEAGFLSSGQIEAMRGSMSRAEFEARYLGQPRPMAKTPVFDLELLDKVGDGCTTPIYGKLHLGVKDPKTNETWTIEELLAADELFFQQEIPEEPRNYVGLRIWEKPQEGVRYMISADVAAGLSPKTRDASCAQVLKMTLLASGDVELSQVAQYYGWIDPFDYGDEIKKLGVYYNGATVIPESTGLGIALTGRLSKQLLYPAVYRDPRSPEFAEYAQGAKMGVDTNKSTKPLMVGAAQKLLHAGKLIIRDKETVEEMRSFEQEKTESMLNVRYRGAGGARDDRVMAICLGCYTAVLDILSVYELAVPMIKNTPKTPSRFSEPEPEYY